jgi:hypothetical protein
MHLAPFIGWSARMEIVRARRVDLDPVQERSISQLLEEDSLCRGTSADVAHADKQNPEIRFVHFDLRMIGAAGQMRLFALDARCLHDLCPFRDFRAYAGCELVRANSTFKRPCHPPRAAACSTRSSCELSDA